MTTYYMRYTRYSFKFTQMTSSGLHFFYNTYIIMKNKNYIY